jgi:hypothetical protein
MHPPIYLREKKSLLKKHYLKEIAMAKIVRKKWGGEYWFVNNELYCGKLLWIRKGKMSSEGMFHFHKIKDETFLVIHGTLVLEHKELHFPYNVRQEELKLYDYFRIKPWVKHRFYTKSKHCIFVEVSTTHSDEDSYYSN